mgnify:CR=1 FL=1
MSLPIQDSNYINTPTQVYLFRMKTLLAGLRIEIKFPELKRRGSSAYAIIKKDFGLRGNKENVYNQLDIIIDEYEADYKDEFGEEINDA